MKVLLTGASGFIGRNVLAAAPPDWDVVAQYRSSADFAAWAAGLDRGRLTTVRCDLADAAAIAACAALAAPFDCIINAAARVDIPGSVRDPATDVRDNVIATANLVRAVRGRHLLHVSTGAVYEGQTGIADQRLPLTPTLPYAANKLLAELYARAAVERFETASRATIVRFFGAYGPFEPAFKLYARLVRRFAIERSAVFEVYGDGTNIVDAMWAGDAAAGLVRLASAAAEQVTVRVVDFAAGRPVTVDELVGVASQTLLGTRVVPEHRGVANERNAFFGDTGPLARDPGVRADTSLEDGLVRYAAWMREAGA